MEDVNITQRLLHQTPSLQPGHKAPSLERSLIFEEFKRHPWLDKERIRLGVSCNSCHSVLPAFKPMAMKNLPAATEVEEESLHARPPSAVPSCSQESTNWIRGTDLSNSMSWLCNPSVNLKIQLSLLEYSTKLNMPFYLI